MYKILLVEDNDTLGYILKEYLELNDYQVVRAENGNLAWEAFLANSFDLCLVDIMLPEKDGFWLAEKIKTQNPAMPLVFLTAKSLKIDKLKGFKLGADDYILKPVDEEELLARLQAVLKRSKNQFSKPQTLVFQMGKYQFDAEKQTLTSSKQIQNLTQKESKILKLLLENENQVLNRAETLKKLWGNNDYFTRRSMDVYISKLRRYLADDERISITTIHNKGFVLNIRKE